MNNIEPKEAVRLVHEFSVATTTVVNEVNSRSGRLTRKSAQAERRTALNLLKALLGRKPTEEEIEGVINY